MTRNILTSVLCVIVVVVHIHARSGPVVPGVKSVQLRNMACRKIQPESHFFWCRIEQQPRRLSASLSPTLEKPSDTELLIRSLTDTIGPPMQMSPCTSYWMLSSLRNAWLWYVGCPLVRWLFDPDEPLGCPFRLEGAYRKAKSLNTDQ